MSIIRSFHALAHHRKCWRTLALVYAKLIKIDQYVRNTFYLFCNRLKLRCRFLLFYFLTLFLLHFLPLSATLLVVLSLRLEERVIGASVSISFVCLLLITNNETFQLVLNLVLVLSFDLNISSFLHKTIVEYLFILNFKHINEYVATFIKKLFFIFTFKTFFQRRIPTRVWNLAFV